MGLKLVAGNKPEISGTLHKARMNGPEEKPNNLGVERRFPGHLDIEPMWFMNAAGNWSGEKKSVAILEINWTNYLSYFRS